VAQQNPVFRSESEIVLVPTLVKDPNGNLVDGLQARDFLLEDDGAEQAVQLETNSEREPASIVVALQTGRRARREFPRIAHLGSLLDNIIAEGAATFEVTVIEFDSRVRTVNSFSRDGPSVAEYLNNLSPGDNGAAILDAVNYSIRLLADLPKEHAKFLLLVSETRDHGSKKSSLREVVENAGRSNVLLYALPFSPSLSQFLDTQRGLNPDEWRPAGAPWDVGNAMMLAMNAVRRNVPESLASMTGGEYELFATDKTFENHIMDFTNHLHTRYVLTFEPKNPHPGLHQLKVSVRDSKNLIVLARTNYWVEK
jgi:VWFA-related protein